MTKLTLEVPIVGEKNTVAEPKVDTALKAIETWANGEVGTNNITAGTVTEAMLTTAVQEKLTTRLGFVLKKENASFEAETEKVYEQEKNGATVTLPAATLNRIITIFCTAVPGCKVKASAGTISGLFVNAATEVELTQNQAIMVIADGTNWIIIAGEPKRTQTYSALKTFTKAEAEAGVETSATRPARVQLTNNQPAVATPTMGGVTGSVIQPKEIREFQLNAGQVWKATQEVNEQHLLL